jgi:hypothetical protein
MSNKEKPKLTIRVGCWKGGDPRWDIYKRTRIVIARRDDMGNYSRFASAWVDTKHTYAVLNIDFDDVTYLGEGDDWDEEWRWIYAPEDNGR